MRRAAGGDERQLGGEAASKEKIIINISFLWGCGRRSKWGAREEKTGQEGEMGDSERKKRREWWKAKQGKRGMLC